MPKSTPSKLTIKYKSSVVFVILFFIIIIDQLTKIWAVSSLMGTSSRPYLNGLFQFVYAENPGAFLGLGGSLPHSVRFVIFAVLVVLGLGGMLWYILKNESSKVSLIAYSFILAGGFGNLWDRVAHENGHVVDFMLIEVVGPIRTGVFNVADVSIVAGVLLVLLGEYYLDSRKVKIAK
ncbi:MAG: signal peptidase II [Pseudobdellovibrio sp.]